MLTRARIQIGLRASSLESGHRRSTRRPPRTESGIAVAGCSATVMLTLAVSRLAALPLLVWLSGTVMVTRKVSLLEALPLLVWLSVTVILTRTVSRLAEVPHMAWMLASTASARVIVPQAKTLLALREAFWTVCAEKLTAARLMIGTTRFVTVMHSYSHGPPLPTGAVVVAQTFCMLPLPQRPVSARSVATTLA